MMMMMMNAPLRIKLFSFAFALTFFTLWNTAKIDFEGNSSDVSVEVLLSSLGVASSTATTTTTTHNSLSSITRIENDTITWPFASSNDVFIYLMHVGKAGGKSLYEALNVTRIKTRFLPGIDCRIQQNNVSACPYKEAPFQLSKRLMGHFHLYGHGYTQQHVQWLHKHTNLLLFTVRNPVDRLVSAWNYHRHESYDSHDPKPTTGIRAELFSRCFSSIEQVAAMASLQPNASHCARRGAAVLQGEIAQPVVHFRYNYEYYTNFARKEYPDKAVAVVRTEKMWNDLARLEELLGGDASYFWSLDQKGNFSRESAQYAVKSGLSQAGIDKICCLVVGDFLKYHELLLAAVNLRPSEKRAAVEAVQRQCGMQSNELFFENATKWIDWHAIRCVSI